MNKLLLAGLSVALVTLGACNKTPTTEEAAVEALNTATETLAKFRTCAEENVLADITTIPVISAIQLWNKPRGLKPMVNWTV